MRLLAPGPKDFGRFNDVVVQFAEHHLTVVNVEPCHFTNKDAVAHHKKNFTRHHAPRKSMSGVHCEKDYKRGIGLQTVEDDEFEVR